MRSMVNLKTNEEHFQALRDLNIYHRAFYAGIGSCVAQIRSRTIDSLELRLTLEPFKQAALSDFGAKGGRTPKADDLTKAILEVTEEAPEISALNLLRELFKRNDGFNFDNEAGNMAQCADETKLIRFTGSKGQEKAVNVSALKDRLSRAKKDSRKADNEKPPN